MDPGGDSEAVKHQFDRICLLFTSLVALSFLPTAPTSQRLPCDLSSRSSCGRSPGAAERGGNMNKEKDLLNTLRNTEKVFFYEVVWKK